jgi:DNA-binding response OmpR family regulator
MQQRPTESVHPGAAILLVEDDIGVARAVTDVLEGDGYRVRHAANGAEAKSVLRETRPDLVVLDLILPDMDGLVLCAAIMAHGDAGIIICSGTPQRRDLVLGLKLGADDFLAKPFDVAELEARVESVLRRANATHSPRTSAPRRPTSPPDQSRIDELVVDRAGQRVTLGGAPIHLTPTEFRLLSALARSPGEVLTREELVLELWGYQDASAHRTVDTYASRVRLKLHVGRVLAPAVVAVRGFGFKLQPVSDARRASHAAH